MADTSEKSERPQKLFRKFLRNKEAAQEYRFRYSKNLTFSHGFVTGTSSAASFWEHHHFAPYVHSSDAEALNQDWQATGADIAWAMHRANDDG